MTSPNFIPLIEINSEDCGPVPAVTTTVTTEVAVTAMTAVPRQSKLTTYIAIYGILYVIINSVVISVMLYDHRNALGPLMLLVLSFLQPTILLSSPYTWMSRPFGYRSLAIRRGVPMFFLLYIILGHVMTSVLNSGRFEPAILCAAIIQTTFSCSLWFSK
jgi:hypothetical protein